MYRGLSPADPYSRPFKYSSCTPASQQTRRSLPDKGLPPSPHQSASRPSFLSPHHTLQIWLAFLWALRLSMGPISHTLASILRPGPRSKMHLCRWYVPRGAPPEPGSQYLLTRSHNPAAAVRLPPSPYIHNPYTTYIHACVHSSYCSLFRHHHLSCLSFPFRPLTLSPSLQANSTPSRSRSRQQKVVAASHALDAAGITRWAVKANP